MMGNNTVVCVLVGGKVFKMMVHGQVIFFEDSIQCGPMPTCKDGRGRHLPPSHRFWNFVSKWYETGKRIGHDGFCLVDEVKG